MKRESMAIMALVIVLLASLGLNVYQYGQTNKQSSLVESNWTDVKQGYVQAHVVINGTVFDELEVPFLAFESNEYNLSNVTFAVRSAFPPNNNGGFVGDNIAVIYHGAGSQMGWNATLFVAPVFISQTRILVDFTKGTTPIVGVVLTISPCCYEEDYLHFLVSSS